MMSASPKEFISQEQDFSSRTNNTYWRLLIMVPVCVLAIVAIVFSEGRHRSKSSRILDGLGRMDALTISIIVGVGFLLLFCLLIFLKIYYAKREIVVGLKFNDESGELKLTTRRVDDAESVNVYKYQDLVIVVRRNMSDGMTEQTYDTLALIKGESYVGHVYKDHFTWDDATYSKIREKLRVIRFEL